MTASPTPRLEIYESCSLFMLSDSPIIFRSSAPALLGLNPTFSSFFAVTSAVSEPNPRSLSLAAWSVKASSRFNKYPDVWARWEGGIRRYGVVRRFQAEGRGRMSADPRVLPRIPKVGPEQA